MWTFFLFLNIFSSRFTGRWQDVSSTSAEAERVRYRHATASQRATGPSVNRRRKKSNWKIIISRNILAAPFLCLTLIKGNVTGAQGFSSQFLIQSRTSTSDFERELYRAPQWMDALDFFLIVPHLNVTTWLNNQIIIKITLGNKQSKPNWWATSSVLGLWFRFLIRPLKKLDAVANGRRGFSRAGGQYKNLMSR